MALQNVNGMSNPYGYNQLYPYTMNAPIQTAKTAPDGGRTLIVIVGALAASVLCGMVLALGLGIGAAGIISSSNLTNVTNSTS